MAAPPKKVTAVRYKAARGMTYSAADAKKNHYICPMDKSKLVPIKTAKSPVGNGMGTMKSHKGGMKM